MIFFRLLSGLFVCVLLGVGCVSAPPAVSSLSADELNRALSSHVWRFSSFVEDGSLPDEIKVSDAWEISFEEGQLRGRICNHLNGSYEIENGSLVTGPVAVTQMACADNDQMHTEQAFLEEVGKGLTISVSESGVLTLAGQGDGRVFTFVPAQE